MALFLLSMGDWMVIIRLFYIFLLLLAAQNQSQARQEVPQVKSNLRLLENILDNALQGLKSNNILLSGDSITVNVITNDSIFSATQKSILQEILFNKYKMILYTNTKKNTLSGKIITFRWLNWQILYKPLKRRFWQKKNIQRNLVADFFVEFSSNSENKILFSKRFQHENIDILKENEIKIVQNPQLLFTLGILEQSKGVYKKWLEPVFLFAISGGVIYLFYSIRSK